MLDDKFFTCQDSSSSSIRRGTALILRQNFIDLEKKYTRKGRDVSERVGKEKKDRAREREKCKREEEENKKKCCFRKKVVVSKVKARMGELKR